MANHPPRSSSPPSIRRQTISQSMAVWPTAIDGQVGAVLSRIGWSHRDPGWSVRELVTVADQYRTCRPASS